MAIAHTILMIRPAAFGYNEETADSNFFQNRPAYNQEELQTKALQEFDEMLQLLKQHEIDVIVVDDTFKPVKPDAIFPNNWFCTFTNGTIAVFPLYAPSRRAEKREDILKMLAEKFVVNNIQDWSEFEAEGRFLEGTGSMVMDHEDKMIYASVSARTSVPVLEKFATANGYQAIVFLATDKEGNPVYHTNVMMTLGEGFAVICEETIDEEWELIAVRQLLESTGYNIIPITREQMHAFAGNMLQVKNKNGEKFLLLSQTAFNALRKEQKQLLDAYSKVLPITIPTIEQTEGGSVRCMVAEIFLERR
jgi:hypothetical protein